MNQYLIDIIYYKIKINYNENDKNNITKLWFYCLVELIKKVANV